MRMSAEELYGKWLVSVDPALPRPPWRELSEEVKQEWAQLLSSLNPASGRLFYARRVLEYVGPEAWLRNTLDRAIKDEMVLPNGGIIRSLTVQGIKELPADHQPLKKL